MSLITHQGGGRSIFFIALYYLAVTTQITLGYFNNGQDRRNGILKPSGAFKHFLPDNCP